MKHLLTPHITEKSYAGISEEKGASNTYTFKIKPGITKEIVQRIVEREFKVDVTGVRIVNLPAKARRFRGIKGMLSVRRKAIVSLKAGQRIDAFDLPEDKKEDKE